MKGKKEKEQGHGPEVGHPSTTVFTSSARLYVLYNFVKSNMRLTRVFYKNIKDHKRLKKKHP